MVALQVKENPEIINKILLLRQSLILLYSLEQYWFPPYLINEIAHSPTLQSITTETVVYKQQSDFKQMHHNSFFLQVLK